MSLSGAEQARKEVEGWWKDHSLQALVDAFVGQRSALGYDLRERLIARLTPVYERAEAGETLVEAQRDEFAKECRALRERAERAEAKWEEVGHKWVTACDKAHDYERERDALRERAEREALLRKEMHESFVEAERKGDEQRERAERAEARVRQLEHGYDVLDSEAKLAAAEAGVVRLREIWARRDHEDGEWWDEMSEALAATERNG